MYSQVIIVDIVLYVNGELGPNTGYKFRAKMLDLSLQNPTAKIHVVLNSVGGVVDTGRLMARIIRSYKANTFVTSGDRCYSACTIVFMGGVLRSNKGLLGFHNAWYQPTIPLCQVNQLVDEFVTGQAYGLEVFVELSRYVDDDKLRNYSIFYASIMKQAKKNSNRIIHMPIAVCKSKEEEDANL